MTDPSNHPVFARPVLEMLTVANEYCLFTEKTENYEPAILLDYYRKILPLVYLKATVLEKVDASNPEMTERTVTQDEWETKYLELQNKLYPNDHFWVSSDLYDEHADIEKSSIAECICDVYQDLKDFLELYQKNLRAAKENAVNQLIDDFREHSGPAIARVMAPLHELSLKLLQ